MSITTISTSNLRQDPDQARQAAYSGPVFITKDEQATHVLMSIEHYQRLTGERGSIIELLAMPGSADIDIEIERAHIVPRSIDLS